jgi:hypothetical protein
VVLADGASGAAEIAVDAGTFDRVLHIRGASQTLGFSPALTSTDFRVTLEPVLGEASACVERIELRHAGVTVATVVP